MKWLYKDFTALSNVEQYAIHRLRQEVFIVEQACPYLDADGGDLNARHLCGWMGGELLAYSRVYHKNGLPHIGRVAVAKSARGQGIAREMMLLALTEIRDDFGSLPVEVNAQSYLRKFYSSLGFQEYGKPFLDIGIEHIHMRREP